MPTVLLLLLQSFDDGAETGGHYVAMSRIKKHGRVIDHSSTTNGMHGIKLMVACSSSTKSAIVYKVGGVLWKWLYSVFKMGKSEEETSLPLLLGHNTEQTRKKHLYCSEIYEQRRFITASL